MTNFEKILRGTNIADMADALSASFEGQCGECPAQLICQSVEDESDVGCTDVLKLWLNMEAEPMPEAPREAGGYGGPWPVCNPGWGGNRITYVDSHGRVHEIGCGGAGARAYDINGELVLELPE